MQKIIVSLFSIFIIYLFIPESKYILKNKSFLVRDGEVLKYIDEKSEKIILHQSMVFEEKKLTLSANKVLTVDKENIILDLQFNENIFIYNITNKAMKKLHKGQALFYNKKHQKIVFSNEDYINISDINMTNIVKLDMLSSLLGYGPQEKDIVKISEDEFLYTTKRTNNNLAVIKYNIKTKEKERMYHLENISCTPSLGLSKGNVLCAKLSKKEDVGYFTINVDGTNIRERDNISGRNSIYLEDINAILYEVTKLKFTYYLFPYETFEIRIYFLDTDKDYLWSKKYFNPVEIK